MDNKTFKILAVFIFCAQAGLGAFRPDFVRVGLLRYGSESSFDPYPFLWRELARSLESATSIESDPIFKNFLEPTEEYLKDFGLVFLMGQETFAGFNAKQRETLGRWMRLGGGLLVIVNLEGKNFDRRIREEIAAIFPKEKLENIPMEHALFRSFYLVRTVGGVLQRSRALEGVKIAERYALIYSQNDLLGALAQNRQGAYLYNCYPGGETQRKETFKLMVNIFLYALTGTYKTDIIHSPFIERKLKI